MNWSPRFSHLYIEQAVADAPKTRQLRERFPKAEIVLVDDYQEVFGRGGQDFAAQKKSPKLIIARKKEDFLYSGNQYVQNLDQPHFCYTALVLNCLYDCRYCYLQGMYASANLVVFVNSESYFQAVEKRLSQLPDADSLLLALSYDTDLLALEKVTGTLREWLPFIRSHPRLITEVRTKSAAYAALADEEPCERMILAWTLSPETVARDHEPLTPGLGHRLRAAREAIDAGWPVRLCFDPLLRVPDWQKHYRELVETTFSVLKPEDIYDVSVGVFRLANPYYDRMRKMRRSRLLHYPMTRANNAVSYSSVERREMTDWFLSELRRYLSEKHIHLWT